MYASFPRYFLNYLLKLCLFRLYLLQIFFTASEVNWRKSQSTVEAIMPPQVINWSIDWLFIENLVSSAYLANAFRTATILLYMYLFWEAFSKEHFDSNMTKGKVSTYMNIKQIMPCHVMFRLCLLV